MNEKTAGRLGIGAKNWSLQQETVHLKGCYEPFEYRTTLVLRMPESRMERRAVVALAENGTVYPQSSLFMDCQAMEMNQLVALAQRRVECTGRTIALRRTTTITSDPLGLRWNSYIHCYVFIQRTAHVSP